MVLLTQLLVNHTGLLQVKLYLYKSATTPVNKILPTQNAWQKFTYLCGGQLKKMPLGDGRELGLRRQVEVETMDGRPPSILFGWLVHLDAEELSHPRG